MFAWFKFLLMQHITTTVSRWWWWHLYMRQVAPLNFASFLLLPKQYYLWQNHPEHWEWKWGIGFSAMDLETISVHHIFWHTSQISLEQTPLLVRLPKGDGEEPIHPQHSTINTVNVMEHWHCACYKYFMTVYVYRYIVQKISNQCVWM